ncbi:MAG: serine protease [Betaproteobacteria bacterium]|nr:serine protease [Betaproteobacteria bacterium]
MRRILRGLLVFGGIILSVSAFGQALEKTDPVHSLAALAKAQGSVVAVRATSIEGAASIQTLGRQREGSGVVIGKDGLILTIGYLILESDQIQVTTQFQKVYPAKFVGFDAASGLGLLQTLTPLQDVEMAMLGSSLAIKPGDRLMAASGGEVFTLRAAELVDQRPFVGYWEYQLDAALYTSPPLPNHSGAGLFNDKGELLGIGSLFMRNVMSPQMINLSLPGNMFVPTQAISSHLTELIERGSVYKNKRPWLGLSSQELNGRIQIIRVSPNSPAQKAGIKAGDLILGVNGMDVSDLAAFYKKLWAHSPWDAPIRLNLLQGARLNELTLPAVDRLDTLIKPPGV